MHQSLLNKTLLALAVAGSLASPARAQATTPLGQLTGTGAVAYESQYVYRGKKISNSSIQPTAEVGLTPNALPNMNVYVGAWSNQPISRRTNDPFQTDEIDVWGGIHYDLPSSSDALKFSADLGDIYYWYPEAGAIKPPFTYVDNASFSDETYVGLTWHSPAIGSGPGLNPSIYYYHDWILAGNTVEASLSTTWSLDGILGGNSGFSLKPTIVGGWTSATRALGNQLPAGATNWRNGYVYWKAGVELDYNLSPLAYLFGELDYSANDDGTTGGPGIVKGDPQLGGTPNNIWFGTGLKFRK